MRVALVTHCYPSVEHPYIYDWTRALVRSGVDLTVFCEQVGPDAMPGDGVSRPRVVEFANLAEPGRSLVRCSVASLGYAFRPLRPLHALRVLAVSDKPKTALRKAFEYWPCLHQGFDVVHFNAAQIAIRRFELGRILGGKVIVSFRGQDFTFHPDRYDRLLREADHLHFISRHLLEEARKRGYLGGRHSLIPPAIDTDFYRPAPVAQGPEGSRGPYRLFTAARLTWTKGWEFALQAVAMLVEQGYDIRYHIAGDGEMRPAVAYAIRQLGLEGRVHLLGWLSPEQVRQQLWEAHVYVLASVGEAFNNSVLQAQACGVPVVCTDAGGLPENVQDGVTGLVARRRDPWDLAAKIRCLLDDPERRREMGVAARRRVKEQFSLKDLVPLFLAMYERVCA
jgi:colanic acid/amylovoran biosynthesis glycosyltransferase